MPKRAVFVGLASLATAAVACNGILGLTGDTTISGDGGVDGSSDDSPATTDSGAPDASDDASSPYCKGLQPPPSFCADFDEGSCLTGWDESRTTGGTLSLDTQNPRSPPAACVAASPGANVGLDVVLIKKLSTRLGGASFAFDAKLELTDPGELQPKLGGLLVYGADAGGQSDYSLWLQFPGNKLQVVEQYPSAGTTKYNTLDVPVGLTPGKWTRFELDTTPPPTGKGIASFAVKVDGVEVFTHLATAGIDTTGTPGIQVGLFSISPPSNAWRVRYDNVVLDAP